MYYRREKRVAGPNGFGMRLRHRGIKKENREWSSWRQLRRYHTDGTTFTFNCIEGNNRITFHGFLSGWIESALILGELLFIDATFAEFEVALETKDNQAAIEDLQRALLNAKYARSSSQRIGTGLQQTAFIGEQRTIDESIGSDTVSTREQPVANPYASKELSDSDSDFMLGAKLFAICNKIGMEVRPDRIAAIASDMAAGNTALRIGLNDMMQRPEFARIITENSLSVREGLSLALQSEFEAIYSKAVSSRLSAIARGVATRGEVKETGM